MEDLTILYITNNKVPDSWAEYHKGCLIDAIGNTKVITLSRKPMDFGTNLIQTDKESTSNIYWQMLRGAKVADTDFVAMAEDDTLYPEDHFKFRPPNDSFAYNSHRWCLYTWGEPVYSLKNFIRTNVSLIAPRRLMIEALEERFSKYPHDMDNIPLGMSGELGTHEDKLGVTRRRVVDFKSENPIVQFDHDYFTGRNETDNTIEHRHTKILGTIKAYDIPVWGKASDLVKKFI